MTTSIDNLKGRAEFVKRYITDILKESGLCIYGVNKDTNELYLADRKDVYDGTVDIAVGINLEQLNNLF